jgi:hypothetical protein
MERVALDVEALHLGFFDPDSLLVVALVQGALDRQAGFRRGGPDPARPPSCGSPGAGHASSA